MVSVTNVLIATIGLAAAQGHSQALMSSEVHRSGDYSCVHPPYKVHLVSRSPLVMYLEGFLTAEERGHLQELANGQFQQSAVAGAAGAAAVHSVRTSQSTTVPRDALVRCIEDRAIALQGFNMPASHLEPIQLVRYGPAQHYHYHTDWFTDAAAHATAAQGGNRASSIFAYVRAAAAAAAASDTSKANASSLTGGGTNFPLLDVPLRDERWCRFVDCDDEYEHGVTFRPVEGNAIYWENLLPLEGRRTRGDQRTLHAGLPVVSGEKIGMNIWTREAPLPPSVRGE
ncbi:Procollagen-proline 4-dioxygenase [Purpureocillium takamizusanense]|uniref:Procollagen-proline 4-dioxygenase n=1 Tax=Purpureocillium takamizusanense TaxID=2060973 RepID=A0A9Q8QIJ4_9HYPO|nr:Procollagen-proline 4-dioxygenase [Purpureocillium takamizusanense]UNI19872.1 Procollagen-proline 4-dioxygenase [Purpureocillium takamizusanense]